MNHAFQLIFSVYVIDEAHQLFLNREKERYMRTNFPGVPNRTMTTRSMAENDGKKNEKGENSRTHSSS